MHCFADACLVEISEELCMRELMMLIVTEMKVEIKEEIKTNLEQNVYVLRSEAK